jgi:hypothetical protein
MKVKIGNYRSWINSDTIARNIVWWRRDWLGPNAEYHPWIERLSDWLDAPGFYAWLNNLMPKRKISVKIDPWDTFSANHTLALVIHPVLVQLRNNTDGSPWVDNEDVPEHLHSTPLTEEEKARGHVDENFHARWNWVLDEMIWAFEQHTRDCWESDYYSGEVDFQFKQVDDKGGMYEMIKGPRDTFTVDLEGVRQHEKRMANGLRLFGKYYNNLWR